MALPRLDESVARTRENCPREASDYAAIKRGYQKTIAVLAARNGWVKLKEAMHAGPF